MALFGCGQGCLSTPAIVSWIHSVQKSLGLHTQVAMMNVRHLSLLLILLLTLFYKNCQIQIDFLYIKIIIATREDNTLVGHVDPTVSVIGFSIPVFNF